MNCAYVTTEIEKWNDIFRLDQSFLKYFCFRGQSDSNWNLTTSLSRLISRHHSGYREKTLPLYYETQMMNDFKWKYPSYEKGRIPEEHESIEWLSLMQHYGSPTRMLDFSNSLYVALFMALDGSSSEKSAIWAINKSIIKGRLEEKYQEEKNVKVVVQSEFEAYTYNEATDAINNRLNDEKNAYLYITRPHMSNERINRQQGLFIIPSIVSIGFDEILKKYYDETMLVEFEINNLIKASESLGEDAVTLLKIVIPKVLKYNLSETLEQMNITSETMYPGLDGLARSMSRMRRPLSDRI